MEIVERARIFATAAHAAVGQKRKYTGEDYIVHPIAVMAVLKEGDPVLYAQAQVTTYKMKEKVNGT